MASSSAATSSSTARTRFSASCHSASHSASGSWCPSAAGKRWEHLRRRPRRVGPVRRRARPPTPPNEGRAAAPAPRATASDDPRRAGARAAPRRRTPATSSSSPPVEMALGPRRALPLGSLIDRPPVLLGKHDAARPRAGVVSPTTTSVRAGSRTFGAMTAGGSANVHGARCSRPPSGSGQSNVPSGTSGSRNARLRCTGPGLRVSVPDAADQARPAERAPVSSQARDALGHPDLGEHAHRVAEELDLVDRLVRPGRPQLRGTVGGQHQQRDAGLIGLERPPGARSRRRCPTS